jgi:hypothetical protein
MGDHTRRDGPGWDRWPLVLLAAVLAALCLGGLGIWAIARALSDPVQTQASNEVLDAMRPAGLREVGRSSQGNGGYTLVRTYALGDRAPRDVVQPPPGFEVEGSTDIHDDRSWDTVLSWAGASPKGDGDCIVWVAVSRSEDVRPRLLRLTASCLALEVSD